MPFSNSFYANLDEIYQLKEILQTQGIGADNGLSLVIADDDDTLLLP